MDDYHSFVEEMERNGFTVRIEYYRYRSLFTVDPVTLEFISCKPSKLMRYFRRSNHKQFTPYPKGGKSVLSVYDGGKLVAKGIGKCMLIDNFSYKEARHYAIENLEIYGFTFPVKADAQIVISQKVSERQER